VWTSKICLWVRAQRLQTPWPHGLHGARLAGQELEQAKCVPRLLHEVKEDLEQKGRRLVLRWIYYLEVDDFRHDLIQLSEPRGLWLRANSKVIAIAIAKLMVIAK
jgi:hypothetical protein